MLKRTDGLWLACGAFSLLACSDDGTAARSGPDAGEEAIELTDAFIAADPAAESPSGHTVVAECSADGTTWDEAAATIEVHQVDETTTIHIEITDARPETLFTAWLRLKGTDPDTGEDFGGSPITEAGSTPLAPSTELEALVAMSEGPGEPQAANAFTTDDAGAGTLQVELDFPLVGGRYPFDRYDPSLEPVQIVGAPVAPFMIRLASHCTDGLAHGVDQGAREMWFNWSPQ